MSGLKSVICSRALGEIPSERLQLALQRFDLGVLLEAEAIGYGHHGQNLALTSDKGKFIFRGSPHDAHQLERERFFVEWLHAHTRAPVPWPFHLDESLSIFKWPYAIMPCMPGIQFADAENLKSLSPQDWIGLASALGENLAEMQRLTWSHCGGYDAQLKTIVPKKVSYTEHMFWWTRHFLGELRKYPLTTDAGVQWVEEAMACSRGALEVPFTPSFVMGDLHLANQTATKTSDSWQITGIFDFVLSYFGNGEEDLPGLAGFLHKPDLIKSFFDAYLIGRPPTFGFAERLRFFALRDSLKGLAWGHQIGAAWVPKEGSLRNWCEPNIEHISQCCNLCTSRSS